MNRKIRSMVSFGNIKQRYIINLIVCFVILMLVQVSLGNIIGTNYLVIIAINCCISIVLAVSLNLTTGCLGEMVLGQAAFMAVGAYASGLLLRAIPMTQTLGFIVGIVISFITAGIVGFFVGIPALRLKGDYLAIITLGFGLIIKSLLEVLNFTGGAAGIDRIPRNTNVLYGAAVVIIVIAFLFTFMRSRFGRSILAIRENEIAASAIGIHVTKTKVLTFALSAALAGIAGSMYAQYMRSISPANFNLDYSIEILVIVVLGGLGSFTGSILAASVLVILPEFLRVFNQYRMIIYALALIIIMLTKPAGLLGRYEFSLSKLIQCLKSKWPKKKVKADE